MYLRHIALWAVSATIGLGLVAGLAACERPKLRAARCLDMPEARGQVIARVGQGVITGEQLLERVRAQGHGGKAFETPRGRRELLDDAIRFELLAQAGQDRGLMNDPEVIDAARRVMVRKLLQRVNARARRSANAFGGLPPIAGRAPCAAWAPRDRAAARAQRPCPARHPAVRADAAVAARPLRSA